MYQLCAVIVYWSEPYWMVQLMQGLDMEYDSHISGVSNDSSAVGEICLKYFVPFYMVAQNIYGNDEIQLENFVSFINGFSIEISKNYGLTAKSGAGPSEWPAPDTLHALPSKIYNNGMVLKALTLILEDYNPTYTSRLLSGIDKQVLKGIFINVQKRQHRIFDSNVR